MADGEGFFEEEGVGRELGRGFDLSIVEFDPISAKNSQNPS